jgi:hypothetical protein
MTNPPKARGHCRHCVTGCEGVSGVWEHAAQDQPTGNAPIAAYAVWGDGDCPMCAEAERIIKACDERGAEIAARKEAKGPNWECRRAVRLARIGTLMDIVTIVRGES